MPAEYSMERPKNMYSTQKHAEEFRNRSHSGSQNKSSQIQKMIEITSYILPDHNGIKPRTNS